MIKINLLPGDQGGGRPQAAARKASSGPSPAPFYLLLALMYLAAGAAGYFVYTMGLEATRTVNERTAQRDRLKKDVASKQADFEQQNLLSQEIEEKYAVVEALGPQNRIFWSEKVNMISMARLNLAVYVTKIELEEQIDERETPESVQRREDWKAAKEKNPKLTTPEPQPVKQPVINQTLVIQAIAYGNDSSQRLAQIRHFYENLNALEWTRASGVRAKFTDRMAPEFEQLPQKVDRVAGVDVLRFGFRIKADPQLDRASDEVSDDAVAQPNPQDPNAPTISKKRAETEEVLN
jgi:hypothetical protein